MYSIRYFNVSPLPNLKGFVDGNIVLLRDLIQARKTIEPDIFKKNGFVEDPENLEFDPMGIERPMRWETSVATIVYCLSGHIPDRQEVLRGRQMIFSMPQWFKKKYVQKQFVLSFLPYILIGMKSHVSKNFQSESNSIEDTVRTIVRLFESDEPAVISFLCPHRAPSLPVKHALIAQLPINKVRKCLNVQSAILSNRLNGSKSAGEIIWFQQLGTRYVSQSLFPEIFMYYLETGTVWKMIKLLDQHYNQISGICANLSPSCVNFRTKNLDEYTEQVNIFLEKEFGINWRKKDFSSLGHTRSPFLEIAMESALPEVKRFILPQDASYISKLLSARDSYYVRNLETLKIENGEDVEIEIKTRLVTEMLNLFFENLSVHPTAKAVYETAFYYLWGKMCSQSNNLLAIGIDRDHARYQHVAWNLGYATGSAEGNSKIGSIVYLRRTDKEICGDALSGLSFRQFWR